MDITVASKRLPFPVFFLGGLFTSSLFDHKCHLYNLFFRWSSSTSYSNNVSVRLCLVPVQTNGSASQGRLEERPTSYVEGERGCYWFFTAHNKLSHDHRSAAPTSTSCADYLIFGGFDQVNASPIFGCQ